MAITSIGYERAITYGKLGLLLDKAGASYSVGSAGAFAAAAASGGDRLVSVQPGRAVGRGIIDDSDSVVTLTGSSVGSGNRWDLLALRRHWASSPSGSNTTLALIPGGPTKAIPTRLNTPGEDDDQPLFLVRFAAGQTAAQEFIDLRTWRGDGGMVAKDLLVRDFLPLGSRVWIQGITWVYGFNASGTPAWVPDSVVVSATQPPYFEGLAWIKTP